MLAFFHPKFGEHWGDKEKWLLYEAKKAEGDTDGQLKFYHPYEGEY